ncbi:MAG: GNAT family N-acetyltransferase [Candidatus Brocadiales bacterium]|nr:GNAT family N-acetyltransferase [Candidatus Bathyanammoxibius sp.]
MESNTKQVTIETPRLTIRPLQREDVPVLAQLGTDEVFDLLPEIETPFNATAWVEHKLEREEPNICHVVFLRETGMPVGFVQANIVAGQTDWEIHVGFWFGQDHWGNGYATETLCAVLENLTENEPEKGKIRPLYAHVHEQNLASIRVLEKCGFALEGPAPIIVGQEGMLRYEWIRD